MGSVVFCAAAGSSGVTTTALLTAALAPAGVPVLFAELDPSGGDVAAWMGSGERPGVASLVTASDQSLAGVGAHLQRLASGLSVLVAPVRAQQAAVAVREVSGWLVPLLAADGGLRAVCDAGRVDPVGLPMVVTQAGLVVVVVRQQRESPSATAARVDRTGELIERLARAEIDHGLVVIGAGPYRAANVAAHVGAVLVGVLPEDPRGAGTAAGGWTVGGAAGRSVLAGAGRHLAGAICARLAVGVVG